MKTLGNGVFSTSFSDVFLPVSIASFLDVMRQSLMNLPIFHGAVQFRHEKNKNEYPAQVSCIDLTSIGYYISLDKSVYNVLTASV